MGDTPEPMDPEEAASQISKREKDSDVIPLMLLWFLSFIIGSGFVAGLSGSWAFGSTIGLLLSIGIIAVIVTLKYPEWNGRFYQSIGVALLGGDFRKNDPASQPWMTKGKCRFVGKLSCGFALFSLAFVFGTLSYPEESVNDSSNKQKAVEADTKNDKKQGMKKNYSDRNEQKPKEENIEKKTESKQNSENGGPKNVKVAKIGEMIDKNRIRAEEVLEEGKKYILKGTAEGINSLYNEHKIGSYPKIHLAGSCYDRIVKVNLSDTKNLKHVSCGDIVSVKAELNEFSHVPSFKDGKILKVENKRKTRAPIEASDLSKKQQDPSEWTTDWWGRTVEVHGTVDVIGDLEEHYNQPYYVGFLMDGASNVYCLFRKKSQIMEISEGEEISIIGRHLKTIDSTIGLNDESPIRLEQCEIVD